MTIASPDVYGAGNDTPGMPMPIAVTEKPQRETWLDWLPPDVPEPEVQLNRADFLQLLARNGVAVNDGGLRFWERAGVLPRAVRRWDPEAKTSKSYYPLFLAPVVIILRELQETGHNLQGIAPLLRQLGARFAVEFHRTVEKHEYPNVVVRTDDDLDRLIRALVPPALFRIITFPAIMEYIALRERFYTTTTQRFKITFTDFEGWEDPLEFPIRDEQKRLLVTRVASDPVHLKYSKIF